MREIKFRGRKYQGAGEWVYGNCLMQDTAGTCYIANNIAPSKSEGNYVEVVSVCQFTWFKDKNDKDIYDGDIISFTVFDCFDNDNEFNGVVKFYDAMFEIWHDNDNPVYGTDGPFVLEYVYLSDCELEVIGNIYDNPELLERKRRA